MKGKGVVTPPASFMVAINHLPLQFFQELAVCFSVNKVRKSCTNNLFASDTLYHIWLYKLPPIA